ncbi:MAG: hypothetical protein PHH59_15465 [Methylovulum sp.]|uniref:hypothetical protein n=1 Tax=Methylovulum sp. TaxID=1916980 RepID=UPI00262ADD77|nr:hypothetical protein [Methylovulum sp.]MDD2725403.1 hypothetical protein [Methylovulum sp.]MDD5124354.1 hypothetical protein [Methylovulum sp.]
MRKFFINMSLLGLAVALLAPVFPLLAILVPPLGLVLGLSALVVLVWAVLGFLRSLISGGRRWHWR